MFLNNVSTKKLMKKVKNKNFSPISDLGIEMFVCLHKHNRNLKIDYFYFPIRN